MDLFLVYILISIFLGGLVRTYFGFGEALVSMPLLALIGLNLHTSISLVGLAGLTVA
ncbi:sulfite exporter TauE/SafE family protein, partial [Staphylococcus cohnii]